jgi:hypothetical protein
LLLAAFVPIYTDSDYDKFAEAAGLRIVTYERLSWACLAVAEKASA